VYGGFTAFSGAAMQNALSEFYRCQPPIELRALGCANPASGYFSFGPGLTCYGKAAGFALPAELTDAALPDVSPHVRADGEFLNLPFDPGAVIDNLRLERYPSPANAGAQRFLAKEATRRVYYALRPLMWSALRHRLHRLYFRNWKDLEFPQWPVDTTVERLLEKLLALSMEARGIDRLPFIWFWPRGAAYCLMMTHDVETEAGLRNVERLMELNAETGLKASFQFVPEHRYHVPRELLLAVRRRGFEVNLHGLDHKGNLFGDRANFLRDSQAINRYAGEFGAEGFRSPCMYRHPEWCQELRVAYDMSTPNVAHLDPQPGGCCTVFPYFIGRVLELPLTTAQDYTLFHVLGDYSTDLWKQQMELIAGRHGLVSFNVHPDYILAPSALSVYQELLGLLSEAAASGGAWIAAPGEVNEWWRQRSGMTLARKNGRWIIEGEGSENARIAYARREGSGKVSYTLCGA